MSFLADLANIDEVLVDQRSYLGESTGKTFGNKWADIPNVYDFIVPEGKGRYGPSVRYQAKEYSTWWNRCLCSPNHSLQLGLKKVEPNDTNGSGTDIVTINRPFKCCCAAMTPLCQKEITIIKNGHGHLRGSATGNTVVGYILQPWCGGCFTPTLNIYRDNSNTSEAIGTITGPSCCIGGCYDSSFNVNNSNGVAVATIKRLGLTSGNGLSRTMFTDADRYQVKFMTDSSKEGNHNTGSNGMYSSGSTGVTNKATENDTDAINKLVILSGTLLLDYMFFEGETNWTFNTDQWPPKCSCKCCDLYCCGCLIPMRCNCDLTPKTSNNNITRAYEKDNNCR